MLIEFLCNQIWSWNNGIYSSKTIMKRQGLYTFFCIMICCQTNSSCIRCPFSFYVIRGKFLHILTVSLLQNILGDFFDSCERCNLSHVIARWCALARAALRHWVEMNHHCLDFMISMDIVFHRKHVLCTLFYDALNAVAPMYHSKSFVNKVRLWYLVFWSSCLTSLVRPLDLPRALAHCNTEVTFQLTW